MNPFTPAADTTLVTALRRAFTVAELHTLHHHAVDQLDADTPSDDPLGRLTDAIYAAAHQQPVAVADLPDTRTVQSLKPNRPMRGEEPDKQMRHIETIHLPGR